MASMTEEKTLAEPRDKEALFHLLKGELTDAGLKGAARAVFETEEAKRGLWDAFKEDGIAAARGYFNRKVGVATGSNVDDTTWGALCARLQPDLSEHHYAALRAMKGTDRLQLQDMVKRGDAVSAIILFIELILPAAGKRKRDGANAGGAAVISLQSTGNRAAESSLNPKSDAGKSKASSAMSPLGSGSNGSVFVDHENKEAAVKRFCVRSVQHRELAVLRLIQGARGVPELIDPQPLNGVRMKRYVKPTLKGTLDVQQASQDLWAALNALWAAGFCHTDVKPDNVMYDDGTRSYVLIDFSNAVRIGSKMEYARNEFVDPAYQGMTRKATVAADQYSFLCVVRYWHDMVQH